MRANELKKQIQELQNQQTLETMQSNLTRARSITVGTAFGGMTEISLRGDGDKRLWVLLTAAETLELIHQLAGNIGCLIHIKPRNDFGSWRQWKETEEQPQLNSSLRAKIEHENQPGSSTPVRSNENVMATKKTVNRRNTKRAAKAP